MVIVALMNFEILLLGGYSELGYWMWHKRQAWSLHQVPTIFPHNGFELSSMLIETLTNIFAGSAISSPGLRRLRVEN